MKTTIIGYGSRAPFVAVVMMLGMAPAAEDAIDPKRKANTIILDKVGVKNLRIETVTVGKQDFETTVFAIGRIEEIPANRSVLSSRISGHAVTVNVFQGDYVEKGQVLVEVKSRKAGIPGSPPAIVQLEAVQSGLVIDTHVRLGQPVEPESELLDISDRSQMWAVAKIPEKEAAGIAVGTRARIHIPALGDELIEATLTRFGIVADRAAGTVEGVFQIPNPEGLLRPGMRAEFSIITGSRKGVKSVPRTAVQGDPSKRVVFVKDFELKNAFVRTPVVLGEQNDRYVEILSIPNISGLFSADEVVTRGSYSLAFAGAGSISLKDALDAAHGHEHNEDGSEKNAAQKAVEEAESEGAASGGSKLSTPLLVYAGVITLLFLGAVQMLLTNRKAVA